MEISCLRESTLCWRFIAIVPAEVRSLGGSCHHLGHSCRSAFSRRISGDDSGVPHAHFDLRPNKIIFLEEIRSRILDLFQMNIHHHFLRLLVRSTVFSVKGPTGRTRDPKRALDSRGVATPPSPVDFGENRSRTAKARVWEKMMGSFSFFPDSDSCGS